LVFSFLAGFERFVDRLLGFALQRKGGPAVVPVGLGVTGLALLIEVASDPSDPAVG
jgi:hypothetical protein